MGKKDYSLALKFTAKTSEAAKAIRDLHRDAQGRLRDSRGRFASMNSGIHSMFSSSNSSILRGIGSISFGFGGVASIITRIGGLLSSVFVGGLKMALGLVGRIAKGIASLPMTGLKFLAIGAAGVFAAHKSLSPAAEMERYKTQLDVMGKSNLYGFLTRSSAGKPFQMGETVQAGVLLEAFKIGSKKFLSTVMDAAAGFKKPLEEIVRMLGYARSGRTGEALESGARIGITRDDLKKFGIKFQKSGAATAATAGKLMAAMIQLMKKRFGGMASRIGTGTYEGAVSDMKDSIFRAFANAGQKFLPYATKIVRSASASITLIGSKLRALPWDIWGAKLAKGVETTGRIINNLLDPKRRKDIISSIADGWNKVKSDIPALGKAIALDLADIGSKAMGPKINKIFFKVFESGGSIFSSVITDALAGVWNTIYDGLLRIGKWILNQIADLANRITKMLPSWMRRSDDKEVDQRTKKLKDGIDKGLSKLFEAGKITTTAEKIITALRKKWLESPIPKAGNMVRTKQLINKMYTESGAESTARKITAGKEIMRVKLSLQRNSGYINGAVQPLSSAQTKTNYALQWLARMLPEFFAIKKEKDVFGREIKQFSIDMKADNRDNLGLQKQILAELRKLNQNMVGNEI
jgi:hypothetical protein